MKFHHPERKIISQKISDPECGCLPHFFRYQSSSVTTFLKLKLKQFRHHLHYHQRNSLCLHLKWLWRMKKFFSTVRVGNNELKFSLKPFLRRNFRYSSSYSSFFAIKAPQNLFLNKKTCIRVPFSLHGSRRREKLRWKVKFAMCDEHDLCGSVRTEKWVL